MSKLDQGPVSLSAVFSKLNHLLLLISLFFFLLLPLFQFLVTLLPTSQRSVGHIHRPGEGKSTAAKEKADISVTLRGLSRWLLQ